MNIVNASESVKTHIRQIWEAPEDADERAAASEAVAALFALAGGWLDIVALEIRLGLYDRETCTEAGMRPGEPFHLLRAESVQNVRVNPTYRAMESRTKTLDACAAVTWVNDMLSQASIGDARYEPSVRELLVAGLRARLPGSVTSDSLKVSCYAGEIEIPVDRGWVTAPATPPGVPDPVSLRITNLDGALRLVLEVFWSAWANAPEPSPAIRDGLSRLHARGWRVDE